MNYKTIKTFNDIEITNKKTLIICDIDNTILYHDVEIGKFINILKKDGFYGNELISLAHEMMNMHCIIFPPSHTDSEGFRGLKSKLNGKIIFLTARSKISENFTKKQFQQVGLKYEDYDIHYTDNKISKGEFIKLNIDTSIWEEIIFIDDYIIPESKCYKFEITLT